MDPEMIAVIVFGIGAGLAMLVPYLIKVRQEALAFDMQYFYGLILSVVVAAFVALPAEVDVSFRGLIMLFLAGMGMQGAVNKGVSALKKRK